MLPAVEEFTGRLERWIRPRPGALGLSSATIAVLILALLIRLAWISVHPVTPIADFQAYSELGRTLAQDGIYGQTPDAPQAFWPPGWPVALAGLYAFTGQNADASAMYGAVFEWVAVVIAAVVAARLLRPPFAFAAAAVMCLYPSAIGYAPVLATEHIAALLFTGLVTLMAFTKPDLRTSLAVGLIDGALILVRGDYGVAMAPVAAVWLVRGVDLRRLPAVGAVALAGALLFVGSWTVRNASTFGEFIPTSTNGGLTFYLGTVGPRWSFPKALAEHGFTSYTKPKAHENVYYRLGWERIKDDPIAWLALDAKRVYYQYGKENTMLRLGEVRDPWIARFALLYWWLIVGFAIVGFVVLARRRHQLPRPWLMIAASILAVSFLKLFFAVNERDRLPLTYLMIVIAGLGAQQLFGLLEERRSRRSDVAIPRSGAHASAAEI